MHLFDYSDLNGSGMINTVNDGNELVKCWCGWPCVIHTVQIEDMHGYGYWFRSITDLEDKKISPLSMIVWMLFLILSTVKEL